MKKVSYFMLMLCLVLSLTACGGSGGGNAGSEPGTLADIYALDTEEFMEAYDPENYACVYKIDGAYTRVEADMPEGLYEEIDAISFEDETRDEQVKELLGPVEIKKSEDVSALVPDDDACADLVGMTAQELQDAGYEMSYYTVFEGQITVNAVKDYAAYLFVFDGDLGEDDPDWMNKIASMPATEASAQGLDYTVLDAGFTMP